ncbi:hypothetical protein Lser_V15G25873 [Lactuca serriola]
MSETQADGPIDTHTIDDVDTNDLLESSETEEINNVNVECDEDKSTEESILGNVFDTPKDAYTFYNDYAFLHGFGIRIHHKYKNKTTNEPYRRIYVCNKEGFKRLNDNTSSGNKKKRRRDVRIGCKAMLRISKQKDEKWFVDMFNDTHNHDLSMTPTKVMKHRSHGKFHRSMECKSIIVELNQAGLKSCQIKKAINAMKTSDEVDVTSKQCVDVLSEQRKQYRGKEFYGLIKHFQDKSLTDNDHYFVMDVCDDGCPRNMFSADGRSREAYTKFGDVVVFDVTYMTNKYKMSFAPFVRVNQHGQSILFGRALLENEKEETFEWLFENFLKCMFGKFPKASITDQDKAMGNAIKKVFPQTRHRFCAWHIKKHESEHLRPFVARYSDFQESYRDYVNSDTIEEFETKFEVICVESRRATEEDEDFKTMNSRAVLSSVHPIEAKADDLTIQENPKAFGNSSQGSSMGISQVDLMAQFSVRDPSGPTKTKGRPKNASRIKSSLEVPKKRTCSYCQGLGHYASSCSKRKADESLQEKD